MYASGPSDEELAAIGLLREDVTDTSSFDVWPDNWLPFKVFNAVATQWRSGVGGPTGLDYNVVKWIMELMKIDVCDQPGVLDAVSVMENAALNAMSRK